MLKIVDKECLILLYTLTWNNKSLIIHFVDKLLWVRLTACINPSNFKTTPFWFYLTNSIGQDKSKELALQPRETPS